MRQPVTFLNTAAFSPPENPHIIHMCTQAAPPIYSPTSRNDLMPSAASTIPPSHPSQITIIFLLSSGSNFSSPLLPAL